MTYHPLIHVTNSQQCTYIYISNLKERDLQFSTITCHMFFWGLKYLLCLPISPINAGHYDMTRLRPVAIDYNIFDILHCFSNKNKIQIQTEHPPESNNWWNIWGTWDYFIIPYAHNVQLVGKRISVTARTCAILKSQRRVCHTHIHYICWTQSQTKKKCKSCTFSNKSNKYWSLNCRIIGELTE